MVPWPVHDAAVAIEFTRAHGEIGKALQLRYDKAASVAIDRMLQDLSRYIGDGGPTLLSRTSHGMAPCKATTLGLRAS